MARIRSIKPDFWQDEKMAPLCALNRLVFLGLISQADDAGRLVDNVRLIDGLLFPQTTDTSRESLDILARLKRIVRYAGPSGQRLLQIVRWKEHQKVDNPGSRVLPAPPPELLAAALDGRLSGESVEDIATLSLPDVGSGSKEVGSRMSSSSSRVRERLADDADRAAFDTLLARVPEPTTWAAECEGMLDGMGGHFRATPALLGKAIRDFTGNGKLKSPNLRQFRRYVKGAAEDVAPDSGQAARVWALIKSQGIHHRTTQREIDTEVQALVTSGSITSAAAFNALLKKLNFDILRKAQQESFAVKHIAENLNGSAELSV